MPFFPNKTLLTRGFTLIELMIVLSLIALLAVLCVPALIHIKQKNNLTRVEHELISALMLARNQSVTQNKPLNLVPSHPSNNWSYGMMLIDSHEKDDMPQKALQHFDWSDSKVVISWHGFASDKALRFSPDFKTSDCSGHFLLKYAKLPVRKLIVNRLGRIRLTTLSEEAH